MPTLAEILASPEALEKAAEDFAKYHAAQEADLENLRNEFADVMADKAVTVVSGWTEPNHDDPCDEDAYLQRMMEDGPAFAKKMRDAFDFI